jgi:uncharacterized protein YcfL
MQIKLEGQAAVAQELVRSIHAILDQEQPAKDILAEQQILIQLHIQEVAVVEPAAREMDH